MKEHNISGTFTMIDLGGRALFYSSHYSLSAMTTLHLRPFRSYTDVISCAKMIFSGIGNGVQETKC